MIFQLEFMRMRYPGYILALCFALGGGLAHAEGTAASQQSDVVAQPATQWPNVAQEVLLNALSLTGVQYKYGGKSPETGFDCSGFVRYVFQQAASLTLPHGARAISQLGQAIPLDQLQPGDLVFFNTLKSAFSHVGIYMGEGRFIHAPSSGGDIRIVDMNDSYWAKRFNGARRLPVSARQLAEVSAE
ncbi:MAG TPA: C40 family peptidase [Methylophilaceae bacterium]|nr:C40 family peptidase [Methylophilaceae bacterium]HQR60344.1 C40 family peptidase [Methylophilaceae bacterium]